MGLPLDLSKDISDDELEIAKKRGYLYYEGFRYGYKLIKEMRRYSKEGIIKLIKDFNIHSLAIFGEKDPHLEIAKEVLPTNYIKFEIIKDVGHSYKEKEEALKILIEKMSRFLS